MHKKFVGGFKCPVCPPPMVAGPIQFTRALNSVKSSFDLLLLDHSLEVLRTVHTERNLHWWRRIIKPMAIHSRS